MAVESLSTVIVKDSRPHQPCEKFFYNRPMKYFLLLLVITSAPLYAFECKLTGVLQNEEKIVTSFVTENAEDCKALASKTGDNNFFGLVEKDNKLIETKLTFKATEEEALKESVSFEEEESYSNDG